MAVIVRLTGLAREDLGEIGRYIARGNPARAVSFINDIHAKSALYAQSPAMGRDRSDLASGVRSFAHGEYVIFYRPIPGGIRIVRALHGRRDIGPTTFPGC